MPTQSSRPLLVLNVSQWREQVRTRLHAQRSSKVADEALSRGSFLHHERCTWRNRDGFTQWKKPKLRFDHHRPNSPSGTGHAYEGSDWLLGHDLSCLPVLPDYVGCDEHHNREQDEKRMDYPGLRSFQRPLVERLVLGKLIWRLWDADRSSELVHEAAS